MYRYIQGEPGDESHDCQSQAFSCLPRIGRNLERNAIPSPL